MSGERILVYIQDAAFTAVLDRAALQPAGFNVQPVKDRATLQAAVQAQAPDLIILGDPLSDGENGAPLNGVELGEALLKINPGLAIMLIASQPTADQALAAYQAGLIDYLAPPLRANEVLKAVRRAIQRRNRLLDWLRLEVRRSTQSLQRQVDNLEALQRVGRAVSSSLDLDSVLTTVVEAAVELTGAEEGSLLLLDESSGELYMRAARNFREEFVRTFRIPTADTLAGDALRSGRPVILGEKTPQKIKTSYLVRHLMYVPLLVQDRPIGVLGVDNRTADRPFSDYHVTLVKALADYAAIAIENARLFDRTEVERAKLETILTRIKDGVIVVDPSHRLLLINQTAQEAFGVSDPAPVNKPVDAVFQNADVLDSLSADRGGEPFRTEIPLEDGRVFNAQVTPIPELGIVVTMQDITHLKELDRIKSDFVSTVSHDLRSPLTAILGYVELIHRVGPVNSQQKEFIRRVEASVQNITALINDLLDLGRIEAGFDARKEVVPLGAIIQYTVDGYMNRAKENDLSLDLDLPAELPAVLGNPVRLRQMVANLVGNAVKYTPKGGKIAVRARSEGGQIILQISDNGPGIPAADQPYIFDKFYRASNVAGDTPGTGLGLAIVKSIIENHQGRIWVDSGAGQGTTFTIVLPVSDQDL
jgi:two-component system NtrC family sensor kinase